MDYVAMGKRIKKLRLEKKWTQEKLAEATGISLPFIGHIERGTRKMSIESLVSISQTLNVSADYLLGLSCSMPKPYQLAIDEIKEFLNDKLSSLR